MLSCPHCSRTFTNRLYLISHVTRVHIRSGNHSDSDGNDFNVMLLSPPHYSELSDYTPAHQDDIPDQVTTTISKQVFNLCNAFSDTMIPIFNMPPSLTPPLDV